MPSRQKFMLASALATSAIAAPRAPADAADAAVAASGGPGVPNFPLLLRGQYDFAAMMDVVTKPAAHRQCFLSNATLNGPPGVVNLYEKMTNAWTAFEFAFHPHPATQQLTTCGVIIAANVVFALNDAMWKKYRIAEMLKLQDLSGRIVDYNYAARPSSNLNLAANPENIRSIYHDYSSAALLKRGASFLVCHNAIAGTALRFVPSSGLTHTEIIAEWSSNVLPGFIVIPAGAAMVEILLEHGWHLYPVTD
jgi:hypothetical protein